MIIFKFPARYARHQASKRKPRARMGYDRRNAILKKYGFDNYADYLASPLWKAIREAKLAVDPLCEICDEAATEVHHVQYNVSVLFGRQRYHLVSLCEKCHKRVEFRKDGTKRTFRSVRSKTKKLLLMRGRWAIHTRKGRPQ